MSYLELLKLASPEATVVVTALIVLAIGLTNAKAAKISSFVALIGLAVAVTAVLMLPAKATLFSGMIAITPLTSLFKIILLILAAITVLLGQPKLPHRSEFLAMLLLATIGLMLLVGSEELLMIFIGLELTGLSLYVMTAFDKSDQRSAEAGLKYFLFGSTASAFTLFGLSLVYGMTGTTGLVAIAEKLGATAAQPLLAAGLILTLVGFGFKVAAAPFHLWAPDTYQGAPVPAAAFIASGSKVGSFVVLGKILLIGFAPLQGSAAWHAAFAGWTPIVATLAAASIVLGNLVALAQTNVRRLLAYSAIAHGGYTLLGLVATGRDGFSATLFYTTIYALTLLGAFGVVGLVRRETGGDDFQNFAGLSARSPLLAGCMTIFMLSLAGLPPLAGFFGKFYLFSAAMRAGGDHGLLWLVVVALFGSLISLYYYLTILKAIFAENPKYASPGSRPDFLQELTVSGLALAVLLLGILPGAFVRLINASLQ